MPRSSKRPPQPANAVWFTIQEAAAYLRVTPTTVYRWCDEGRLHFYELESGGGRRFKREDLDALLKPGQAKENDDR